MEWIDVDKRLPEYGGIVLIYSSRFRDAKEAGITRYVGTGYLDRLDEDGYYWARLETRGRVPKQTFVTHWMPLPKPPEEVKP